MRRSQSSASPSAEVGLTLGTSGEIQTLPRAAMFKGSDAFMLILLGSTVAAVTQRANVSYVRETSADVKARLVRATTICRRGCAQASDFIGCRARRLQASRMVGLSVLCAVLAAALVLSRSRRRRCHRRYYCRCG